MRDSRHRIMEMAEEKTLAHADDEDKISSAVNALMNPRKRLAAEIAWFSGLAPKTALDCVAQLHAHPDNIIALDNISPIARANLLAGCLIRRARTFDSSEFPKWIVALAEAFDEIDKQDLLASINEDRDISGFPKVSDRHALQHELDARRQYYRSTIVNSLSHLSIHHLAKVVTNIVESTTDTGNTHAPIIVDELVDSYAIKVQEFLDEEERKINQLLSRIHKKADEEVSNSELSLLVDELISNIECWDAAAQPIQVSTKSLGLEHDRSMEIALKIRKTAIFLFSEHNKFELCQRIIAAMQKIFAEVLDVAERAEQDMHQLDKIGTVRNFVCEKNNGESTSKEKTHPEKETRHTIIAKPENLLNHIFALCTQAVETATKNPSVASLEAQKLNKAVSQLLSNLKNQNASDALIHQGKDIVAAALMRCAVILGNETGEWLKCAKILEDAMTYAESKEVIKQIRSHLLVAKWRRQPGPAVALLGAGQQDFAGGQPAGRGRSYEETKYVFNANRYFFLFFLVVFALGGLGFSVHFPTEYTAVLSFLLEKWDNPLPLVTAAFFTLVIYGFIRFLYDDGKLRKLPSGTFIGILFVCLIWSEQIHTNIVAAVASEAERVIKDMTKPEVAPIEPMKQKNVAVVASEAERVIKDMTKPEVAPIEPMKQKNVAVVASEAERVIKDMTKPEVAPIEPMKQKNAVAADCDSSSTAFFQTATAQIVEECIQKGQLDINSRDVEYDGTPLHVAAASNPAPAVISALLEAGADFNSRAEYGVTPLHTAAFSNTAPAVISALLEAGAYINSRDEGGLTPLHWAAAHNPAPAVISALLEAGADINSRDEGGFTPLHGAAAHNPAPAVISALLEAGADINSRNEGGNTPLHEAALENPEPAVISALLEAGADINSRNKYGNTPLLFAAANNSAPAVISALLEASADPKLMNNEGKTAWDYIQKNSKLKDTDAYWKLNDLQYQ